MHSRSVLKGKDKEECRFTKTCFRGRLEDLNRLQNDEKFLTRIQKEILKDGSRRPNINVIKEPNGMRKQYSNWKNSVRRETIVKMANNFDLEIVDPPQLKKYWESQTNQDKFQQKNSAHESPNILMDLELKNQVPEQQYQIQFNLLASNFMKGIESLTSEFRKDLEKLGKEFFTQRQRDSNETLQEMKNMNDKLADIIGKFGGNQSRASNDPDYEQLNNQRDDQNYASQQLESQQNYLDPPSQDCFGSISPFLYAEKQSHYRDSYMEESIFSDNSSEEFGLMKMEKSEN